MERYRISRCSRPGRWLVAALAADFTTYVFAGGRTQGVILWVLLDLWLAHRIWNGGPIALTVFRFLQTLGAALFGVVLTFGGPLNMQAAASPMVVVLYVVSAWCLFAQALDVLVARRVPDQPSCRDDDSALKFRRGHPVSLPPAPCLRVRGRTEATPQAGTNGSRHVHRERRLSVSPATRRQAKR